jgi:hypothetical protein
MEIKMITGDLIYYKVAIYWPEPAGCFVIAIDNKKNRILSFFETDINNPVAVIDFNTDKNKPIPQVPGFHFRSTATAMMRAWEAMRNNDFQDVIIHANCAVYITLKKMI